MNLSNPILSPFILCSILWQWIPQFYIYVFLSLSLPLVQKSISFCWFYTCDPFQLRACQFLCSEKEWVVYLGSLSLYHFLFYRLLWHLLSSVFYGMHNPNFSSHRCCFTTCCPHRPHEGYGGSHQKSMETKQGTTAGAFVAYSPSCHRSRLRLSLNRERWAFFSVYKLW